MDSPPLAQFLRSVGRVQHHLHTVVVGLAGVEKGAATKPDDLDISWRASDPVGSAREARRFVLRATLIFVAEALKEYATRVLKFRGIASHTSPTLPKTSAERIRALAEPDQYEPSYLGVAPLIVSHWRNRIVHRESGARLTAEEEKRIVTQADAVRASYKNVDIARLLQDFEEDRPTLKDVTVLLAMSVKFVRAVDSGVPSPTTPREVTMWLEAEELLEDVLKLEKRATNGGSPDPRARARQYLLTKSPGLAGPYHSHGVVR